MTRRRSQERPDLRPADAPAHGPVPDASVLEAARTDWRDEYALAAVAVARRIKALAESTSALDPVVLGTLDRVADTLARRLTAHDGLLMGPVRPIDAKVQVLVAGPRPSALEAGKP